MRISKRLASVALALSIAMMANTVGYSVALAKAGEQIVYVQGRDEDPFGDAEQKAVEQDESKMTMKEKLAKMKEEEAKRAIGITVDNVLPGHIYIPKGTMLKMELVNAASSKTVKQNQQIDIKMVENLIINGVVVIPKDTLGVGYVYEVQKAGGFGRKGVLRIAAQEVKTLNNIVVPLRQGLQGKGNTDGGAVAVAAAVSLVGGLFMKGSNINYPAGTDFEVEVSTNVDLGVTKDELKDAMNPAIPHGIELTVAGR